MIYVDMHCDTLTECFDKGYSLSNCNLQTNLEKLDNSGCAAQCFAIFTQGEGSALRFAEYSGFYRECLKSVKPILRFSDLDRSICRGETGAILTVENLGFIGEDIEKIDRLPETGVKMASLVWNYENGLAYPNVIIRDGVQKLQSREKRGLKLPGRQAVQRLDGLKIIIDISHLSDGGAEDILNGRKIPVVASHSNCASVCNVSRNLTDVLIKKIADCGGVVGVNFCKFFLGEGETYAQVLKHINHLVKVGGEDVIAFGSDFDGIPAAPGLEDCTKMPRLIDYLTDNGLTPRVIEKLCYKNFARVFKEVCG